MFARQIAVMKGQAWNVVETLKTADHGPLELTRRARVCVWDDLVDIPVAVPMRVPSAEMRRRRRERDSRRSEEQEEMDISAMNASDGQTTNDLLNFDSPTTDLPNPNRFNLSRNNSFSDLVPAVGGAATPATINDPLSTLVDDTSAANASYTSNGGMISSKTRPRISVESGRRSFGGRRYQSYTGGYGTSGLLGDTDDLEGDLGYAAAQGMERSRRKVIVERLETVKSKNPVFTWC